MSSRANRPPRAPCAGFTLIEMTLVGALMVAIFSTFVLGLRAGHAANREIERSNAITLVADDIMDRLFRINYGQVTDGAASAAQLTALFDDNEDLGTASLMSLKVFAGAVGYQFKLGNFPWPGTFEVRVTADLNGDGDELDANEGTANILRIDILFDGKRYLSAMRARPNG
jgi:hypothetical protein